MRFCKSRSGIIIQILEKKLNSWEMKSPTTISYTVKRALYFSGIWPSIPGSGIYKFVWLTSLIIFQVCQYKYIIVYFKTVNLEDIIDTLSVVSAFSMAFIKLTIAWAHNDKLRYILLTMEEDCQKYTVIDTNNSISKIAHLSYRLTTIVLSIYVTATLLYGVGFVFQPTDNSTSRVLLLKMDLPFDTNETPIYEIVVACQFFEQFAATVMYGAFSGLLIMVILHIGCQVDIMCHTLSDISSKSKERLQFFINRHQELVVFTQKVEELFTYMALSQLLANILITCCLGFLIVTSIGSENGLPLFIKSVIFYVAICSEAFILCFAGEYLNIKSELIGRTAYESFWYNLNPAESKLIILLMARSQKGFALTFGKFSNLSLESFTGIMKVSASYVSMLLAMT